MGKPGSALAAVMLAAALCPLGCRDAEEVELPPELVGRWTTTAPKYADRYFELRPNDTAVFGLGGRQREVSPIVRVERARDGDFLHYRISHLTEVGDVYVFSVSYHPGKPGQLRFVNQPGIVWTKSEDASF